MTHLGQAASGAAAKEERGWGSHQVELRREAPLRVLHQKVPRRRALFPSSAAALAAALGPTAAAGDVGVGRVATAAPEGEDEAGECRLHVVVVLGEGLAVRRLGVEAPVHRSRGLRHQVAHGRVHLGTRQQGPAHRPHRGGHSGQGQGQGGGVPQAAQVAEPLDAGAPWRRARRIIYVNGVQRSRPSQSSGA